MDQEYKYKIIKNVIWGTAVAISATAVAAYHSSNQHKAYETQPERVQAVRELMESPGFQNYLEERSGLAEVISADVKALSSGYVSTIVNATLGNFTPKDFMQ